MILKRLAVALLALTFITACGGGGGGGSSTTPPVSNPAPTPTPTPPVSNPAPTPTPTPIVTSIAIAFSSNTQAVTTGQPQTFPLTITVKDQHGAVIQGTYPESITLTDSDTHGATQLSLTSLTSSTQTVSLNYSGQRLSGPVTISASAAGVSGANITTATFNADATHSYLNGDSFTYHDTMTTMITNSGQPTKTNNITGTETLTVKSPAAFNNVSNLIDITDVDTGSDGFNQTTHDYYAYTLDSATKLLYYGGTYSNSNAASASTANGVTYYNVPSVQDELPHTAGASWNPSAPYTEQDNGIPQRYYTYVDGIESELDGSYVSAYNYSYNDNSTTSTDYWTYNVRPDASYTITENYGDSSGILYNSNEVVGAPTGGTLPVNYTCTSGTLNIPQEPAPLPTPAVFPTPAVGANPITDSCYNPQTNTSAVNENITTTMPDWYPSNFNPLDQEKFTVLSTNISIPSQCNLPAAFGTTGSEEQVTVSYLDPTGVVFTSNDNRFFVPNIGLVCIILTSDLKEYNVTDLTGAFYHETQKTYTHSLTAYTPTTASNARKTESLSALLVSAFAVHNKELFQRDAPPHHKMHH